MSYNSLNEYSPTSIIIKGKIINLKTNSLLKKTNVYFDSQLMDEIDFDSENEFIDTEKTNTKGEFLIETYIDKNDLQLWLKVKSFAQLNIFIPNLDTTTNSDTIDIGTIYLVPYNNELQVESYNMPKLKRKKKDKYDKFSIYQVDSIFSANNNYNGIELNEIVPLEQVTRYNFGSKKPRGTTINKFKMITFNKTIK